MGNQQSSKPPRSSKYSIIEPGDLLTGKEAAKFSIKSYDLERIKHSTPFKERSSNRLLVIPKFFSVEECNAMIERCNNFQNLNDEYPIEYRNAMRELVTDKELANLIFERLQKMINLDKIGEFISPYGLDGRGTWKACGINEMMRFSKYNEGEYFKIHTDGQFRRSEDERSIYTLLIYFNKNFNGGETKFYGDPKSIDASCDYHNLLYTLKPEVGQLALFNQDFYHEGCSVTKGTKYILRTEIMYLRVDAYSVPRDEKFERSEAYQNIGNLFKESEKLEKDGDVYTASESYLKGQQLLVENGKTFEYILNRDFFIPSTSDTNSTQQNNLTILPEEIVFTIFSFLKESDICSIVLPLNRYLNQLARSPIIWKPIYQKYWDGATFRKLCEKDNLTDWYYHTRLRNFTEHSFKPICIDCTNEKVFYGFFNAENPEETQPFVGRYSGGHFNFYSYSDAMIGKVGSHQGFLFSYLGKDYDEDDYHITELDVPTFFSKVSEQVIFTPSHPLLVSIPPEYLNVSKFKNYVDIVLKTQVPAVCFISRHAMIAYYHNIPNCIVIERDTRVTMSVILNHKSFEGDVYIANYNNPIKNELKRGYNQLMSPKLKEITEKVSHVIVVNLEDSWVNEIPNIIPNTSIMRSTDPQEAFRGCQMYASQEDIRPMCTFWSGQLRNFYYY